MRLPKIDSATYRAVVTGLQTFAGFVIAIVASPQAMAAITDFYPWLAPVVVSGASIASFALNFFRGDVRNY